jgi:putative ABC transport system permease protein
VVLAGILAVLGLGVLGHALVSSMSDRRRELAVLRALGLVRRQVNAAVRWHALTLASIALLVGIPLGLAAGRWAWRLFENDLGAGGEPVTPTLALGALLVAAAVVTCLLAVWPARRAQSTPPAAVLRAG